MNLGVEEEKGIHCEKDSGCEDKEFGREKEPGCVEILKERIKLGVEGVCLEGWCPWERHGCEAAALITASMADRFICFISSNFAISFCQLEKKGCVNQY